MANFKLELHSIDTKFIPEAFSKAITRKFFAVLHRSIIIRVITHVAGLIDR